MNRKKAKALRRQILKENPNQSKYYQTPDGSVMIDGAVRKYKDAKKGFDEKGHSTGRR
jgi:hypothetical protein